ncbi:MAG: radical SAM protein [Myxococcales bacterium]|nr:radical SAM protein [Myxococcales bacterium]
MNTATLRLTLRCNLNCPFCNARSDHEPAKSHQALSAELQRALDDGAREVVITGGEPTLHPALPALVAQATAAGSRVVVETNALALTLPGRIDELVAAGRPTIRWGIYNVGAAADTMGQRPGAFALGLKGLQLAESAGLPIELSLAVTARTDVTNVVSWLVEELPAVTQLMVRLVKEAPAGWVLGPAQAGPALKSLATACDTSGLTLVMEPRYALPLCALSGANRFGALFRVAASGDGSHLRRIDACDECAIADMCPGVDAHWVRAVGQADFKPVTSGQRRRARGLFTGSSARQSMIDPSEGMWSEEGGNAQLERVLRVNFHCNQDCAFCFVDRVLPAPDGQHIRSQIDRAAADGVSLLSLSGGEPTLDPDLASYVAQATDLGIRVQIQTNATRLAKPELAERLAKAGLSEAFVSLHGAVADISDGVTRAPGTFEQTLLGIDQLLHYGVHVSLNCVITGPNQRDLEALPHLIAQRWKGKPTINFSWANANSGMVPVSNAVTPRFSTVKPHVARALQACRDLALDWRGLTGECGVPLCFPEPGWLDLAQVPELGTAAPGPGFDKPSACEGCELSNRCVGVRAGYAALHGTDEVQPIRDLQKWQRAWRDFRRKTE